MLKINVSRAPILILDASDHARSKMVFLGASPAAFDMSVFRALFSTSELAGSQLLLVGWNAERRAFLKTGLLFATTRLFSDTRSIGGINELISIKVVST